MVTIHREAGLRFVIYTDDHPPAHVHIVAEGTAKVDLAGVDGAPMLVWSDGLKANDLRRAMRIIVDNRDDFLAQWRRIHG